MWKRRRLHFQPPEWQVEFLPGLDRLVGVVLAFTGHYVIAASADEGEARSHFDPEDIATPFSPVFLAWLGDRLDARRSPVAFPHSGNGLFGAAGCTDTEVEFLAG